MKPKSKYYVPPYRPIERLERFQAIANSIVLGYSKIRATKTKKLSRAVFGASVEITDRCNAGCHHCYVYEPDWDQSRRIGGYLELDPIEHRINERQVFDTLDTLKEQGIIHVTLVGGEPLLFPKAILKAGELFPVVWCVTNGAAKFPAVYPRSVVFFVSIDGPPDHHNQSRDPLGFFAKQKYRNLSGMSAAIVRNINESPRGAFVHITLTRQSMHLFPEAIDWFVEDIDKLRGVVVSGAATKSKNDPNYLRPSDRNKIKSMLDDAIKKHGSQLFPFNQPKVNHYLFDEAHIIRSSKQCTVSRRVDSYGFDGKVVGKCVLRDDTDCETCVCNITGLMRGVSSFDQPTILGLLRTCFG